MQKVNIYVVTDSKAPQTTNKGYMYCLECNGKALTGSGVDHATWHGTNLEAVIKALQRIRVPCNVMIHTTDKYLINMLHNNLATWEKTDFKTARGTDVADAEKWRQILVFTRTHSIRGHALELEEEQKVKEKIDEENKRTNGVA